MTTLVFLALLLEITYGSATHRIKQHAFCPICNSNGCNNKHLKEALEGYDREIADGFYKIADGSYKIANASYKRGNVLVNLGQPDKALESYGRAIQYQPDFAEAFFHRGIVFEDLERFDEAFEDFEKALELAPSFSDALYKDEKLLAHFELKFRSIQRAMDVLRHGRDELMRLDLFAKAADEMYATQLKCVPDFEEAAFKRGIVLERMNRFEEAINNFEAFIEQLAYFGNHDAEKLNPIISKATEKLEILRQKV